MCETIKERAKRTLQGSEDVCQEMMMGPVEVTVSVGLLIVSPSMSVRRNGGEGEVGGEHRERKGSGKEGKTI